VCTIDDGLPGSPGAADRGNEGDVQAERDDEVSKACDTSLLYLVSRVFEENYR
jgi:hypothetical protein